MTILTYRKYLIGRARHCREAAELGRSEAIRRTYLGFAAHYEAEARVETELETLHPTEPRRPIPLR